MLQWQPPEEIALSGSREAENVAPQVYGAGTGLEPAGPVQPDALAKGDIIGERYVVEEHISSGSFGAVYRASDRQIENHQVALKLLHVPAADQPAREAALRELTLLASVSHPSIVQFKDYGWHEGRLWFAMPWYRGQTVAMRYADSQGPIPMSRVEARPIFERLAQGLAAMHDVGIHHHDIKPENVFLADIAGFDVGFPVLLDLGIATKRGEGPKGLTVEYASPETAAAALGVHERPIGAAADVFSLALVLRNALEPESAPSQDGEFIAVLNQRATIPIKPPKRRELRYMRPAFVRWLSLDPDARPTASEFAAELSLLTQPEEQKAARRKLLSRVIPIVLGAALAVSLLLMQVRKQNTEILVQRERLTQEMQESEQLRQVSAQQLQEIDAKSEQLGSQAQRLKRAIAIGKELNGQLSSAVRRGDELSEKVRTTTGERDALASDKANLTRERDDLIATRDRLQAERDSLSLERDALRGDRDRVEALRKDAEAQRDAQSAERERVVRDLDAAHAALAQTEGLLSAERKNSKDLKRENKDLKKRVRNLEKHARNAAPETEAAEPGDTSEATEPAP